MTPKLDAIYDDLIFYWNELHDLQNKYKEEQQELSRYRDLISNNNIKDIIEDITKIDNLFRKRLDIVNKILADIDSKLIDLDTLLAIVIAKKLELDETASTDNQFVICCEKIEKLSNECSNLLKH